MKEEEHPKMRKGSRYRKHGIEKEIKFGQEVAYRLPGHH